jgi:CO/xanthine dehydrogenase Mo-binding subunit
MKGIGESGVGSALGALCSAVENAFPELDLSLDRLILTPCNVWRAIRDARLAKERAGAAAAGSGA